MGIAIIAHLNIGFGGSQNLKISNGCHSDLSQLVGSRRNSYKSISTEISSEIRMLNRTISYSSYRDRKMTTWNQSNSDSVRKALS